MPETTRPDPTDRIDEVAELAHRRVDDDLREPVETFLRTFWNGVPPHDLHAREVEDLYGAAMVAWQHATTRHPGTPTVAVYTPEPEQHGWQSTHSVVDIVTDDMPFLVDSVTMELSRREIGIHLVVYPMLDVLRDEEHLTAVYPRDAGPDRAITEAIVHVEIDRQADADLDAIRTGLLDVLSDVRAAVRDWPTMRAQVHAVLERLGDDPPPVDPQELHEAQAFLRWLDDDHFTFLGFRAYELIAGEDGDVITSRPDTGLGILADAPPSEKHLATQPPQIAELAREPTVLNLTKANSASTVHRPSPLDYIGVKRFSADGEVLGEDRFLGLYTSRVYSARPTEIPVVRRKVEAVLDRADFPPDTHDAKDLTAILEAYPRDELFEITADELHRLSMGILGLQERRQVRLFVRHDRYGRYVSCLVFVPRDHYTTRTRLSMQAVLEDAFDATRTVHTVRLSESVLARLHIVLHREPRTEAPPPIDELERRLGEAVRDWTDELRTALVEELGEGRGTALLPTYTAAFPASYREDHSARIAVADIERLEGLTDEGQLAMSLYRPADAPAGLVRFKLYRAGAPNTLSEVLPLLENLGFVVVDQRPHAIRPADGPVRWIHDFGLQCEPAGTLDGEAARARFQEAFARIWTGDSENDGFNRLVLRAGLGWRDVSLLRAYSRYLRQTETRFSLTYMQAALVDNPEVTRRLCELFHARFDPDAHDVDRANTLTEEIDEALDDVASLDEDRILRSVLQLVQATLRTNYFQRDGDGDAPAHLALKFDPALVPDLPRPRPAFEIFVHSPRTEGVHLRGGAFSRGGLRWSDRREDYRTEVLGLAKAQTVKNAVIVPVGAKGGFVVAAQPTPDDPQAYRDEVQECYRTFIRGLLDITDNIVDGEVVPPERVVRHDGDDPYLVVAADKGTATFSDTANAIATEAGFWLGDAFASGGSAGYDHKAMGITARGAWESVKAHFRELEHDVQTTPFTVVGIGDMSGDVFGNGMLLSEQIRLVAAFDHRHIFIDPDPDPATSSSERARLFDLSRSTWESYDRELLSEGGGIWPRTAKSIPVSEQMRQALGLDRDTAELTPDTLIREILRAPVDLLFNGGVGTFVKATSETHADVGDKSTDRTRVDAAELRCRVIGEGGNLGMTQRARVEFALRDGAINTDAIDNAAGVDCSDHEVNIKVLLDALVRSEDLTRKQRNELLVEMTDEVAQLVLSNNIAQLRALTNATANALSMADVSRRYIDHLEQVGPLDRALEALPSDEELIERRDDGRGLTRPEFAVLLAYTKTSLTESLLASDLPEDPYLAQELAAYLPSALRERFRDRLDEHRLRREIIATQLSNHMVNDAGTTFVYRIAEETGADVADIGRAHAAAREIFDLRGLQQEVAALDHQIPPTTQTRMILEGRRLVERGSRWLLRNRRRPLGIEATIEAFAAGLSSMGGCLPGQLRGAERDRAEASAQDLRDDGVPEALAERVAYLPWMIAGLDIVDVTSEADIEASVEVACEVHVIVGDRLHLAGLRERIDALPRDTRWETLARDALREDFITQHRTLTAEVLRTTDTDATVTERVDAWVDRNETQVERVVRMVTEADTTGPPDLAVLSVGLREIRNLRRAQT